MDVPRFANKPSLRKTSEIVGTLTMLVKKGESMVLLACTIKTRRVFKGFSQK